MIHVASVGEYTGSRGARSNVVVSTRTHDPIAAGSTLQSWHV